MSVRYLVDTDVLSAGAPSKTQAVPELLEWMDLNSRRLYVSVITIAEIEDGIAKSRREGATRKSSLLAEWLDALVHLYSARILSLDLPAARLAGALSDKARGRGHTPGFADVAIGAIARHHDLTVLTRNVDDYAALGVAAHDAVAELPP
ncbi:MAG: PIN domain-containing protein [Steroidobacteraceae bacterium]